MTNLFAICRGENDEIQVKRVQVAQKVQAKITGVFQAQAATFLDGVSEEVPFGGDWKPDGNEILFMDAPQEVALILDAVGGDLIGLPSIDAPNFMGENIKALFVVAQNGGVQRILIQMFTAQQILARRFSLMLDGNTFKELTGPAFTLDNYLVAIVEDNKLKFKSFFNLKRIFQLNYIYQEASDQQIDVFCNHDSLQVNDVGAFKTFADQVIRKLVHAISRTHVLDQYQVPDIQNKAAALNIQIEVVDNKIVMPNDRKGAKQLLRFLDDGIYKAPLSDIRYLTNSKRRLD